jgi:hypothetical protein
MSDFTDTVLSLNPVFFGVLYDPLGSTVITDLSPNGNDGEYHGTAIFGLPSAIETDAASSSVGGPVGFVSAPNGSQTDLRANFTVICFGYYADALAATVSFWGRRGQFGLSNGVQAGINGGTIVSHLTIDDGSELGAYRPLNDPVLPVLDTSYMLTTVRNSTVHNAYTNDRLAATRSDLPTGPIQLFGEEDNPWYIGRSQNTSAFPGLRTCSFILFDYALNGAQVASIYNASINASLLFAVSNASPSAILYSDIEPTPTTFPFRHNWSDSLIERITFRTNVSTARKGYTENAVIRPKPRREIEIAQVLRDNSERTRLHAQLTTHQHRKWFIPILEDRETLTTGLSAGATLMPATVQYRDYEVGSYVELRQLNSLGQVTKHEHALISSLSPLTTTAITNSYNPFVSTVGPARRGYIDPQLSLRGHTGAVEDVTVIARLVAEDEKTIPNRITAWTPNLTYKSYEVFNPLTWQSNDWAETRDYDLTRAMDEIDFDAGAFTQESDALGSVETFSYRMLLQGRNLHAALLGWFYARAGQANYLWVPTMQADFEIVSALSGNLTVVGHGYTDNFAGSEFRRDIAFIYYDNTMQLRRVNGVTLDGDNEVLELSSAVPTQVNLRSVSYLRFCQLAGDTLEIARATDNVARFAWSFRELLSSPT